MLRARRFEETLLEHVGLIRGVFHVGIGQEAAAAAIALARRAGDVLMLNHRNHHHLAAIGSDLEVMYREIFGRDGGPQRGRAGSLHLADPSNGVPYTSAMVGGGVPIGLGMALVRRRRGKDGIAFCVFGDGAMGEGVVHECLNLAALWRLPVLFLCESNAPRTGEQAHLFQSAATLGAIAEAHRVPAAAVDAADARAAVAAVGKATEAIRAGDGPRFAELRSVPWPGNSGFLPQNLGRVDLRSALQPAEGWAAADPILGEVRALLAEGVGLQPILELDAALREEADRAARAATSAPLAPAQAAFEHVWSQG